MSSAGPIGQEPSPDQRQDSKGPNLTLIYSLLALALVLAIGIGALIVLPFYQRH
jgi:hypothetical protein